MKNMAEKIKEARATFESTVKTYSDQLMQGSEDYLLRAGSVYALAVLDAAAKPADSDHGGLDHNDALRRQIEKKI